MSKSFLKLSSLFLAATLFGTIFGCSTVSRGPTPRPLELLSAEEKWPDSSRFDIDVKLQKLLDQSLKDGRNPDQASAVSWWVKYNQAQLWKQDRPTLACQHFHELAQNEDFPLARIAMLRAVEVCSATGDSAQISPSVFENLFDHKKEWWFSAALETALPYVQKMGQKRLELKIWNEKSRRSIHKPDKVLFTQKALQLAWLLQDKAEARYQEKRLFKLSPSLLVRHAKKAPRGRWLDIAGDFRRKQQFDQAKKYYRKALWHKRSSDRQIYLAYQGLYRSFKLERNRDKALEILRQQSQHFYFKFKKNPDHYAKLYHKSMTQWIRALWTAGNTNSADRVLSQLAHELKSHMPVYEIYWLRGRIAEERQKPKKALKWFAKSSQECRDRCVLKDKLLWYQAWNQRKLKKWAQAAESLEQLIQQTDSSDHPRYRFWLAQTLWQNGQPTQAQSEWQTLINEHPFSYYSAVAHRSLQKPLALWKASQSSRAPASLGSSLNTSLPTQLFSPHNVFARHGFIDEFEKVRWMLSVGEKDLARSYILGSFKRYPKLNDKSSQLWLYSLKLLAQAGAHRDVFVKVMSFPEKERKKLVSVHPELLFPRPYQKVVNSAAQKFHVEPAYIYSIMRQESAFSPKARSHADAFGLMQLLPSVARHTARAYPSLLTAPAKPASLFLPEVNIPLGAAHLRDLSKRFDGQFILMTASYNASERAIRQWVKMRFHGDPLEFIEDIPYKETRNYVKLVMRNFLIYQQLNSKSLSVPFPEWCLAGLQSFSL